MFRSLCKNAFQFRAVRDSTATHLCSPRNPFPKTISWSTYSTNQPDHLTLTYLVNSCGLSSEAASKAAKRISIKTPEKPDLVLTFLRNHGFTKTQITQLITKHPSFLFSKPDKTLKPKMDFFLSKGISGPDLAKLLTSDPLLMRSSLRKHIIPSFDLLKTVLRTDTNVVAAIKRWTLLFRSNILKHVWPNIELLRSLGVSESGISRLLLIFPVAVMKRSDWFSKNVKSLVEMGFVPSKPMFCYAIHNMVGTKQMTWEKKMAVYRSLGWSDDETLLAFRKYPWCMTISEEKIRKMMDFFVNKLNWTSKYVSTKPVLLGMSFENRIVLRALVGDILVSKGKLRKDSINCSFFMLGEKEFSERYVIKYQKEFPELLKAYQVKMG